MSLSPGQRPSRSCERVQQQAVERVVDKSIPQSREESVAVVEKFPQEPISERICEQREVIEVTETASQDQNLQRTVEQTVLDFSRLPKLSLRSEFLKGGANSSRCRSAQELKTDKCRDGQNYPSGAVF